MGAKIIKIEEKVDEKGFVVIKVNDKLEFFRSLIRYHTFSEVNKQDIIDSLVQNRPYAAIEWYVYDPIPINLIIQTPYSDDEISNKIDNIVQYISIKNTENML